MFVCFMLWNAQLNIEFLEAKDPKWNAQASANSLGGLSHKTIQKWSLQQRKWTPFPKRWALFKSLNASQIKMALFHRIVMASGRATQEWQAYLTY